MSRIIWIDLTKGIAISLVVFGHVLGGALARGWLGSPDVWRLTYDFIYSFHMPAFFVISGALAIDSIRANPSRAMLSRTGSIAWPYLLWGMIFICLEPVVSRFTLAPPNGAMVFDSLRQLLLGEKSWFLWTLFFAQCILIVTSRLSILVVLGGTLLISAIAFRYALGPFEMLIHYMPFVALGALLGRRILDIKYYSPSALFGIGVLLFCLLGVLVSYHLNQILGIYLLSGIVGSVGCFVVAKSLEASIPSRFLAVIGQASLAVFLLHPYFQGAARELVLHSIGSSSLWQLTIPTLFGIVGPTLVWTLAGRFGFEWLFRLNLADRFTGERSTVVPK